MTYRVTYRKSSVEGRKTQLPGVPPASSPALLSATTGLQLEGSHKKHRIKDQKVSAVQDDQWVGFVDVESFETQVRASPAGRGGPGYA